MRASTLLNRVLKFTGASISAVHCDGPEQVTATVRLTARKKLSCPHCSFTTMAGYDTRWAESSWRHLDVAGSLLILKGLRRRLRCPTHGVVVQAVPFARRGSRFTHDFEDLVAWLVTRVDKTTVSKFLRIAWRTVGAICHRVVTAQLADSRFKNLVHLGVDEISHHNYLTLVSDHDTSTIIWGGAGKNAATLDQFFTEIGPNKTAKIQAVSMDMGAAFIKSVKANAPNAAICIDPFHVVQLATLDQLREDGGALWEGSLLKESLREVFAGDLPSAEVMAMIQYWCDAATDSGLAPFIKAGTTLRGRKSTASTPPLPGD